MNQQGPHDDLVAVDDDLPARALPEELPIFPLNGVLLLPGATLPLNIFEPRYLNMIEDALGSGRMIGMVQPLGGNDDTLVESPTDDPAIYDVGCAGRIISFNETSDGRFTITLLGISRFSVIDELPLYDGYRRVVTDYEAYFSDLDDDMSTIIGRDALLKTVQTYLGTTGIEVDWSALENAPDSALITTLSILCPFGASEKQALLECHDTRERATLLGNLMDLNIHAGGSESLVRH